MNPKVAAGGAAGAVSIVLVWCLHSIAGVEVPPEVAAAFTTILTFAAGWFKGPEPFRGGDGGQVKLATLGVLFLVLALGLFVLAAAVAFGWFGIKPDVASAVGWMGLAGASFTLGHLV